MRKHILLIFIVMLTAMLSGCIVTKTPSADNVTMSYGQTQTFKILTIGKHTFTWYLDGVKIPSCTTGSCSYTAEPGTHELLVETISSPVWSRDTAVWMISSNGPPTANAGANQSVNEEVTVTLDASNSYDPDNDIVYYSWVQLDGPTVTLSDPGAAKPTFTSPTVGTGGATLTFQVTVTDATSLTSTATTIVNVSWDNSPPVANAGPDQLVAESEIVTLDGSASTDPDDGIASYAWEQIAGPLPFVILSDPSAVAPTFAAPASVGQGGEALIFKLTVTDAGGLKSTNTVIVNVSWSNLPPVANAGPDQDNDEGIIVTLDASASTDPDDGVATYTWVQTGGPAVTLSNPNAINPTFTTPDVGMAGDVLTFELTVSDFGGLLATDNVSINVGWVNAAPVANAGVDQKVEKDAAVTLDATASSDVDDGIVSYLWEQTGGPAVTMVNAGTSTASFNADVAIGSVLTFRVTVTDAGSLTATDTCTITVRAVPVYVQISGGFYFTAAIKTDGTLWTWGRNTYGQLGDGTVTGKSLPVQIGTDTDWASIAAGNNHIVAIKTDGTLWAWGYNANGQLGDGTSSISLIPKQIGTANDWIMIDAGANHTVAMKEDASIWAWGLNNNGQLGDGTTTNRLVPTHIGAGNSWIMIEAGELHTAAIDASGKLWAWGDNFYGQLGDGTLADKTVPTQIGTDTAWKQVSAGNNHTVARKAAGTLWAWGSNSSGQLGDGTTADSLVPVQIGSATDWGRADAGTIHTVAVKTDGTLWAWGYNSNGQLGDGTTADSLVPIQIGTDTDWALADAGYYHSLGIRAGSSLYSWGFNNNGQLGDGTLVDKLIPTWIW